MKNWIISVVSALLLFSAVADSQNGMFMPKTMNPNYSKPSDSTVFAPGEWGTVNMERCDTVFHFWFSKKMLKEQKKNPNNRRWEINMKEFTVASREDISGSLKRKWPDIVKVCDWHCGKNSFVVVEKFK